MTVNLKDSNALLAAKYYVSQIPAQATFGGVGMAIGLQVLTSVWKAWAIRGQPDGRSESATAGEILPVADVKPTEVD